MGPFCCSLWYERLLEILIFSHVSNFIFAKSLISRWSCLLSMAHTNFSPALSSLWEVPCGAKNLGINKDVSILGLQAQTFMPTAAPFSRNWYFRAEEFGNQVVKMHFYQEHLHARIMTEGIWCNFAVEAQKSNFSISPLNIYDFNKA